VSDESRKTGLPAKHPPDQQSPNVVLLNVVRKYWVTGVAAMALVVVITVFYTLGQTKIYEAHASVQFDPTPPRPLGQHFDGVVQLGAGSFWHEEYFETQYHIIRSRRVALAVVNELGLHNDRAFIENIAPGAEPAGKSRLKPEVAAELLRSRLKVQPVRDSRLAEVRLRDADPERAQRILNVLLETYVDQNLDSAIDSTSAATDWLRGQLDTLKSDLEDSEMALHHYKKDNDILSVAFDEKSSMLVDQIKHINAELTRVKADLQGAASRNRMLSSVPTSDPTLIQSTQLLQSSLLNQLRADYEMAIRERAALLGTNKGNKHPHVAAANAKVRVARAAILKEITNVQKAVTREVGVLAGQVGGLEGMLSKARKQAHNLNLLEIEYHRLRRNKENTEKLYSLLLERTKQADLSQMMRVNNISIIDRPLVPGAPVSPRVPLNILVGLFAGLLVGVAAAFGRGLMNRTITVPEELESELAVTFLGLVPHLDSGSAPTYYRNKGRKRGKRRRGRRVEAGCSELIVHNEPTSSVAEAARAIRTNLMFMSPDNPHQVLLVTSAGPAEGKTTVGCCIAVAMAQAGQRVALIDCDLRRPRVHRVFKASNDQGVTTALLEKDEVAFGDHAFETEVPNLWAMTSGPVPPNPAELFHTDKFRKLLDYFKNNYDRVILDSPPVGAVTDPAIISTLVDGTVLVARAHSTRKELARHALRSLRDVGGHVVGAVLNAVDFSRSEYRYSYYYYYYRRDGYYGDEPPTSRSPKSRSGEPRDHASVS